MTVPTADTAYNRGKPVALSCEDIHAQIKEYVQNRINEDEYRRDVAGHIQDCSSCREAYAEEVMTRMVVRSRFPGNATPEETRTSIERSLNALSGTSLPARRHSYTRRSKRKSPQVPIFVLLLLVTGLGAYILFFNDWGPEETVTETVERPRRSTRPTSAPTRKSSGPVNFFNQALENFKSIESGELSVQFEATNLSSLKQTFSENQVSSVAFAGVSLPLKGGIVSTHNDDVHLAHMVYSDGTTLLYIFEAPLSTLENGSAVYITQDIAEELQSGEKIWVRSDGGVNLVMYKNGDVVEAAVANTPPLKLQRLLGI